MTFHSNPLVDCDSPHILVDWSCDASFRGADGDTVNLVRAAAEAAGWTKAKWQGRWADLCPRCRDRVKPRPVSRSSRMPSDTDDPRYSVTMKDMVTECDLSPLAIAHLVADGVIRSVRLPRPRIGQAPTLDMVRFLPLDRDNLAAIKGRRDIDTNYRQKFPRQPVSSVNNAMALGKILRRLGR